MKELKSQERAQERAQERGLYERALRESLRFTLIKNLKGSLKEVGAMPCRCLSNHPCRLCRESQRSEYLESKNLQNL